MTTIYPPILLFCSSPCIYASLSDNDNDNVDYWKIFSLNNNLICNHGWKLDFKRFTASACGRHSLSSYSLSCHVSFGNMGMAMAEVFTFPYPYTSSLLVQSLPLSATLSCMYSFTLSFHLTTGLPLFIGPSVLLTYTFFTNSLLLFLLADSPHNQPLGAYAEGYVASSILQCQPQWSPHTSLYAGPFLTSSNFLQESSTSMNIVGVSLASSTPGYPFQRQPDKLDQL